MQTMLNPKTKIHLVGVGGIGMSALAQVYADAGYRVSGSDQVDSPILARLRAHGVEVHVGHRAENIADADVVVCSTAIREDHLERLAAQHAGKPVWKRAELLADVLADKRSIVVTGCHGKTTTTAMITWMLDQLHLAPSALIGGEIKALGGNALSGQGDLIVAEGDESDRSFLYLQPDIAVVTNVDFDHPDHYRDLEDVQETFVAFLARVRPGGCRVLCLDDPPTRQLAQLAPEGVLGYGFSEDADVRATEWRESCTENTADVWHAGQRLGRLRLSIAGRFNLQNALAAIAVSRILELDFEPVAEALGSFPGTLRRMELKGKARGVQVYDDYAHHPNEIAAALQALACKAPGRKIIVFQPHRYSRTQRFAAKFAQALKDTDVLLVANVYSAGDAPIEGVSGRSILDCLPASEHRHYCEKVEQCVERLLEIVQPGDTVLTLGAGNIYQAGEQLLKRLEQDSKT